VTESLGALPIPADARGALRAESVTVLAQGFARPVLDAISVDIPAGSKLVLRGVSGAGKSTLADLLRRFLEPDSGRILLDGRNLDEYCLADLRRRIAVVEHSPILFRGTILDNLCYGHAQVTRAEAMDAARKAGVDEFARTLPKGYDTWIGEGGAGLSTGQRQRIAIARAALARPLVVVLDEATSGMDLDTVRAVHRALDSTFANRTRIIITHRAADVENSDLSWRLEGGQIHAAGVLHV
jgi:ATP-binding cassette subfamily B protein